MRIEVDREEGGRWLAEIPVVVAFHESEEIGLPMLVCIARPTGLRPEDL